MAPVSRRPSSPIPPSFLSFLETPSALFGNRDRLSVIVGIVHDLLESGGDRGQTV
jgi:hypothetical protein